MPQATCSRLRLSSGPIHTFAHTHACRYYLSGNDAYRLKLQLPLTQAAHDRKKREREAILGYPEDMDAAAADQGDAAAGGGGGPGGGDGFDDLPPATEGLIA